MLRVSSSSFSLSPTSTYGIREGFVRQGVAGEGSIEDSIESRFLKRGFIGETLMENLLVDKILVNDLLVVGESVGELARRSPFRGVV
jgi:hypothetical protein